jgi:hypothetical protein
MKKVALVFVIAVLGPSLVLAFLAIRSLRDQQFLLERQQSLICQGLADSAAKEVQDLMAEYEQQFVAQVDSFLTKATTSREIARSFDELLRQSWPLAEVGFAVTLNGEILAPAPYNRPEAKKFLTDNSRFLCSRETAEVYLNFKQFAGKDLANNQQINNSLQLDSNLDSASFRNNNRP